MKYYSINHSKKSFFSTFYSTQVIGMASLSKIASAKCGHFFSKTLNFLLIWSRVLVICVEMVAKSLPNRLNKVTKDSTSL